ncbi:phytanoyl-CoA dioxygenase family protein [Sphingomonas canadensis]|uniref:Phytanoyl-CoA dioxygenase family protein n=1 Tax=Sphingomonas canadensis TaxID=1219257 RepID=A0ABW3H7B2_9SPHN|nr:phytanoyl-CoA dioxygenase family protein [Sphingomonas canadensis]MCW3836649.1 phytanoyl-CoA dioxygenase family protein [Sphingomonas canadensis]
MYALGKPEAPAPDPVVAGWCEAIARDGFALVRGVIDPAVIAALDADLAEPFAQTPFSQGAFFGNRTIRFGRALLRSPHAATLVQHPVILGIAEQMLGRWCDGVQLNLTQAIAVHPGAPAQLPHRDEDMWPGPKGQMEYMVNVIWPFTRFTRETGATRLWRGSHLEDRGTFLGDDRIVTADAGPGDAIVWLGSTLHGQGANDSDEVRRGIAVAYSLSWLKQYENQYLAYPPEIARTFPRELAELIGYRQLPPNLNNYEARSPMTLLHDGETEATGAVDALIDYQEEASRYYAEHGCTRSL